MSNLLWQFFDKETGLPAGRSYSGPADSLEANTPAQCVAVEVDAIDAARRLDLATSTLVDWRPPEPDADELVDWVWSTTERAWVGSPSFEARRRQRLGAVDAELAAAEAKQQRPLGDILVALTSGQTPNSADAARLAELRAYVGAGRAARNQLEAATSDAELQAINWPALPTP